MWNVRNKKNKIFTFIKERMIYIIIILVIAIRCGLAIYNFEIKYKSYDKVIKEVMVVELKEAREDRVTYLVKYDKDNFLLNIYSRDKEDFDYSKYDKFKYADKLKISGKLSIPETLGNPNEFNYKRYLNSNNIVGTISTYSCKKIGEKYGIFFFKLVYEFKELISNRIDEKLEEEPAGVIKSMIYGDSKSLDGNIKEILQNNGLSHIIAVSGANISYLLMIISVIFYDKDAKKSKGKMYVNIIVILCFLILASFSISIIRAAIMAIILVIAKEYNLKLKKYTSLIISLVFIIIYNPYSIFSVSFVFSYLAVTSIIMFKGQIYSFLEIKIKKVLKYGYIEKSKFKIAIYNFFMRVFDVLSIYLSVQVLILPFQIYYFNKIPLIAIISNVITYPIILILFSLSFLILFFAFIPVISDILFNSSFLVLKVLITLVTFLNKNNFSLYLLKPNLVILFSYYIFILLFSLSKKFILIFKKKTVQRAKVILSILFIIYIIYISFYYINTTYFENYIYFFNIGQGNMAFIRYNRKNILIDCGSTTKNLAKNTLSSFLLAKGINKIDLCFISHFHDDHMNLLLNDDLNINIKKIIYTSPKEEIENYDIVKEYASKNNISLIESDIFDFYEYAGIKAYILSPNINEKIIAEDIQNANSMILLMSIKDTNFLFMGDGTVESENYMIRKIESLEDLELKNDLKEKLENIFVLQVGHHGSKTSTSVKNALISSKKQVYGHPNEEVINRLNQNGIKIYITENLGAIKFKI